MSWKDSFKVFMRSLKPEDKAQFKKATEKMFEDEVEDLWSGDMHGVPGNETIPFGPSESASGNGAEVMVNTYSNPAPQQAITGEYEKLAQEMGRSFSETRKALDRLGKNQTAIKEVLSFLLKAEEEEEEEKAHEKAKSFMKKAKISLRKAESAEDEEEKEDSKDEVEKARINLKKAKELLFKAEEEGEDEEEVEKSFKDHKSLSKKLKEVEISLVKAEEEEERDKGNQEGRAAEGGNQDDHAAKSEILEKMVTKTVSEVFDKIMGRSAGPIPVFNVAKADPEAFIKSRQTAVEEAIMDDMLNLEEQGSADSILVALEKAHKGEIDQFVVNEKIRKAPTKVQNLFA